MKNKDVYNIPKPDIKVLYRSKNRGGKLLRSGMLFVVLSPIAAMILLLLLIKNDYVSADIGIISYTVLFIITGVIVTIIYAFKLEQIDNDLRYSIHSLKQSNDDLLRYKEGLDEVAIVAITDKKGVIKYVNDKFCEISKFERKDLIGQTHSIINSGYHPKEFFVDLWKRISAGQIWHGEIKNKAQDGSYYWVLTAIVPFKDAEGKISEYLSIRQDITKRKEAEELLRSDYVKRLEYQNNELQQFVYIASHDLKDPLNTIIGISKVLRDKFSTGLDSQGIELINMIFNSGERMSTLIKELLDYSRLGQKRELTHVDCNELLMQIKEDLNEKIMSTNATVNADCLPNIKAYKTELRLLLQNLITNAIKFQKPGNTPQIEISVEENDDLWQFAVADNGIGIEEKNQDKVFNIFTKLHNREEYEGTGIGLAHCAKVVDMHRGKLWIESEFGEGSTFYFTIPKQ